MKNDKMALSAVEKSESAGTKLSNLRSSPLSGFPNLFTKNKA
jgi:hypothetical protein